MLKHRFVPIAIAEYRAAADYYDAQKEGLGTEFFNEVESMMSQIGENPLLYPAEDHIVHHALLPTFPFRIYYTVEYDHVLVHAIFHSARNPNDLRFRLP